MPAKNPNWFYELEPSKQAEYCGRLKGTRPSKYCGVGGPAGKKPRPTLQKAPILLEPSKKADLKLPEAPPQTIEIAKHEAEIPVTEKYYEKTEGHEWAKKSDIKNLGEDLKDSARHKRNRYRSWEDFEAFLKTDDQPLTKSVLMKSFSPDFNSMMDDPSVAPEMAMYFERALSKFPSKCTPRNSATQLSDRQAYAGAFQKLSQKGEEIVRDPTKSFDDLQSGLLEVIRVFRRDLASESKNDYSVISPIYWDLKRTFNAIAKNYASTSAKQEVVTNARAAALASGMLTEEDLNSQSAQRDFFSSEKYKLHSKDNLAFRSMMKSRLGSTGRMSAPRVEKTPRFNEGDWYKHNSAFEITSPERGVENLESAQAFLGSNFKGIQFGNAMPDKERASHIVAAARSIQDLTTITGLPTSVISMEGDLGIAFGARGTGKAMATYSPTSRVVNLTRKSGYGSLAHELGHALDNYLGSDRPTNLPRAKLYGSEGRSSDAVSFDDFGRLSRKLDSRIRDTQAYRDLPQSGRRYIVDRKEIFARCFEAYIDRKVSDSKYKNTYLVSIPSSPFYPTKEELDEMSPVFEKLFAEIRQSKENK